MSFLTQLSRPPFSSRHYGKSEDKQDFTDDGETSPVKPKPNRIELQLADRRKAAIDGYAYLPLQPCFLNASIDRLAFAPSVIRETPRERVLSLLVSAYMLVALGVD